MYVAEMRIFLYVSEVPRKSRVSNEFISNSLRIADIRDKLKEPGFSGMVM